MDELVRDFSLARFVVLSKYDPDEWKGYEDVMYERADEDLQNFMRTHLNSTRDDYVTEQIRARLRDNSASEDLIILHVTRLWFIANRITDIGGSRKVFAARLSELQTYMREKFGMNVILYNYDEANKLGNGEAFARRRIYFNNLHSLLVPMYDPIQEFLYSRQKDPSGKGLVYGLPKFTDRKDVVLGTSIEDVYLIDKTGFFFAGLCAFMQKIKTKNTAITLPTWDDKSFDLSKEQAKAVLDKCKKQEKKK